ncbi:MAG: Bax inhibitor-1/YccA family protein [Luteibaculaceae bacterium]
MNQLFGNSNPQFGAGNIDSSALSKTFLSNVYIYMTAALAITGLVAFYFGTDPALMSYLINSQTGSPTGLGWIVTFAPLGLVFAFSAGMNRWSSVTLLTIFVAFSVLMGMSISYIFLVYTASSISSVFFTTSITFGIMSMIGYTTKTDLTKFGSILMMALIGVIVAMVVNIFVGSSGLAAIINVLGVLIFVGLIAYDTQKLKRIGAGVEYGTEQASKLALMGALTLYLDFINLFLFLLRFMGDRK